MNPRDALHQAYTTSAIPIPNTPHWYRVRFDPTLETPNAQDNQDGKTAKESYVAATEVAYTPVPEAIIAPTHEAAFVRWNEPPLGDGLSLDVFEDEAIQQARAEHQKRMVR